MFFLTFLLRTAGFLNFVSGHVMADKYVIAVDESKFSEDAFDCKPQLLSFFLFSFFFRWTEVHFVGLLVSSVYDCPWVSKPGWIHRRLCSFVACTQPSPESFLVAGIGH